MSSPPTTEDEDSNSKAHDTGASDGTEGRGNTTESPRTAAEEQELPVMKQFKAKQRLTRRHSAQVDSTTPDEGGDPSAGPHGKSVQALRRSSTVRAPAGHARSLLLGRNTSSVASGISSPAPASSSATTTNDVGETLYEEMMVRFQIRQLQRSASGMTICSEDRRLSIDSSRVPDAEAEESDYCIAGTSSCGLTALAAAYEHQRFDSIGSRRSSRRGSDAYSINAKHDASPEPPSLRGRPGDSVSYGTSLGESYPPMSAPNTMRTNDYSTMDFGRDDEDESDRNWSDNFCLKVLLMLVPTRFTLRRWTHWAMTPFSPFSIFSQTRYAVSLLAAMAYVVCFPMELAYPDEIMFRNVDTAIGVVLFLDMLATLNTGYVMRSGGVSNSRQLITWSYISNRFWLDVLASLPMALLAPGRIHKRSAVHIWLYLLLDIVRMERLAHMTRRVRKIWLLRANQAGSGNSFWAWLLYSRYSHLLRIATIITMLIVIAHYIACIWTMLLVAAIPDDQEDNLPWRESYTSSFYSALLLLQGEGVEANTVGQNLFGSFSVLVGSIVLAVVFGHVAILVSNFNANFTNYQRKMEAVFAMTAKLQLPPSLRERIHEYYEHLWHEYECLDGEIVHFAKELSHTLGLEVVLFKYMELVMHVPFWKDCTPDFQKQLMLRLDVRVYLPDDFIMRQGEVDDEFYMVNRGYCELSREPQHFERVTNTSIMPRKAASKPSYGGLTSRRRSSDVNGMIPDGDIRQSAYELDAVQRQYYNSGGNGRSRNFELMISRGQAFGDLALVMNYQRAANVRAITHVEMCVLSREDFQAVLARYPEDRRRVIVDMLTSYMHNYEINQSHCPLLELVRSVYSPEAIAAACKSGGVTCPPSARPMSAREAAERIYTAINLDIQDQTIKFGVGASVRQQLVELRDRRRRKLELELQQQEQQQQQKERGQQRHHQHNEQDESSHSLSAPPSTRTGEFSRRNSDNTSESTEPRCMTSCHKAHPSARAPSRQLTWDERLRQVEEREVAIQRALRELHASMKQLEAKRASEAAAASTAIAAATAVAAQEAAAANVPIKRKRVNGEGDHVTVAPSGPSLRWKMLHRRSSSTLALTTPTGQRGSDAGREGSSKTLNKTADKPSANPPSRPPLLQRMGSLVGLSSGVLDPKEPTESPTHYTDQLFQSHATSATRSQDEHHMQQQRVHPQLRPLNSTSSSTPSATDRSSRAMSAASNTIANVTTTMNLNAPPALSAAPPNADALDGAAQPGAINEATSTATPDRRKAFHRNHSQSLRALAEAVAPLGERFVARHGSTGSTPNALRRMGSFMTDARGHQHHESPTRYADELFQGRGPRRNNGGPEREDPRAIAEAAALAAEAAMAANK